MNIRQVHVGDADKRSARIFFDLLTRIFDSASARVLDAFARNGELTVHSYYMNVEYTEAWELMAEHEKALSGLAQQVRIGCSYAMIEDYHTVNDMLVIDTPQGRHSAADGTMHFEHFTFFKQCLKNVAPGGLVVLYVNKSPYNKANHGSHGYDEYPEYDYSAWMEARRAYYGKAIINEEMALAAYTRVLHNEGRMLGRVVMVPCFSDVPGIQPYAFRLALEVL